eukprot:235491-Amphidinium_carterae.1
MEAAIPEAPSPTAPDTAQSVHATAEDEQEPASSYLQQALSVLKAPFRTNKKRAHSGSSSEVFPSPRSHIQHQ